MTRGVGRQADGSLCRCRLSRFFDSQNFRAGTGICLKFYSDSAMRLICSDGVSSLPVIPGIFCVGSGLLGLLRSPSRREVAPLGFARFRMRCRGVARMGRHLREIEGLIFGELNAPAQRPSPQPNLKPCAQHPIRAHIHTPPMRLGDLLHDEQPQPHRPHRVLAITASGHRLEQRGQ